MPAEPVKPVSHVVAADLHFLAGELVARETDLGLCVIDILGVRIVVDDGLHRFDRLGRGALVLRHVDDLLGIGETDEILHIGGILGLRILRHACNPVRQQKRL